MRRGNKINQNLPVLLLSAVSVFVTFSSAGAKPEEKYDSAKAARIIEKQGCLHCHFIKGKGGLVGPPLDGISKYRNEQQLVDTLTGARPISDDYPKGILDPRQFMSHVRVSKQTAKELAHYLMETQEEEPINLQGHSRPDEEETEAAPPGFKFEPLPVSASTRKGLQLYREASCAACHSIAGIGGRSGPKLDGIGARRSRNFIESRISRGAIVMFGAHEYKPSQYSMPPAKLPKEQVEQITDFLLTLPAKNKAK